jgi:hypothetical protein
MKAISETEIRKVLIVIFISPGKVAFQLVKSGAQILEIEILY